MLQSWVRPVEQIVLPALENRVRVIGFTAPEHGAGVTSLCRAAAETLTRSGLKVLLLDLSTQRPPTGAGSMSTGAGASPTGWVPGASGVRELIVRDPDGYDVLVAHPQGDARFLFNNSKRLRQILSDDLSGYATIVVDLPPLADSDAGSINPVAAALMCETVMLVCARDRSTRTDIRSAIELAKISGVRLQGTIYNEFGASSLADEISRSIERRLAYFPRLAGWLSRRAQNSPFLR